MGKYRDVILGKYLNKETYLNIACKLMIVLWAMFIINGSSVPAVSAAENNNKALKTYIVHHSLTQNGMNFPLITALSEYLGHFDLVCEEIPLYKWRPGLLKDAELVVYVGDEDKMLPEKLLTEMAEAKRVVWFGRNIEQLASRLKWKDFKLDGVSFSRWKFNYQEKELFYDWIDVVMTQPGNNAQIIATAESRSFNKPIAWQRDNIYFCGFINVDNRIYMSPLGTLLHEFIPNEHSYSHKALLRLEDVSPLTDSQSLHEIIGIINKYRIPYAIGVISVGIAPDGSRTYLHENQELVRVLKEAQEGGASIIMHGYTHQNEYSPTTGEGYEFWNARDDKPMEDDEIFTKERLEAGIAELVRCGLTPVAFEPPHYSMSKTGYKTLSRYFNIFSGEIQLSDKSTMITMSMPYITQSEYLNGMLFVPENMGYFSNMPSAIANMLQISGQILNVPDGLACFFYHPYLPPGNIIPIIEGVQKQGYEFFDLRQLPVKIQSTKVKITGLNGQLNVEIIDEELKTLRETDLADIKILKIEG